MEVVLILYLILAFTFLTIFFVGEGANENRKSRIAMAVLSGLWPITLILIALIHILELYQSLYRKKIRAIIERYGAARINDCHDKLTLKELKQVMHAHEVRAWHLTDKELIFVERALISKTFEKTILGDEDGKEESN